jgi:cytolysin-activating lysine-acyltransferase
MSNVEKQLDRTSEVNAPIDRVENEFAKIFARHTRVAEGFGQLMLLLMQAPRYGHLTINELSQFVLEPLTKGNILLSRPTEKFAGVDGVAVGAAIWAKVSKEVDEKIREQIQAKTFPVKLTADEWNSGEIHWVFDIIAADLRLIEFSFANIKNHLNSTQLFAHPTLEQLLQPREGTG